MTDLILLLLGGAGLSVVVTMSTMFSPVRELFAQKENEGKVRAWFRYMINCPLCFGVYAGAGMYGIMLIPDVGHWVASAFAVSITSFIIAKNVG